MNQGLFCAQINEVEKILIRLELLKNRIQWPSYRSFQASFFKNKSYIDIWQLCIDNDLYDFP